MKIFTNKFIVALVCIIIGVLILIGGIPQIVMTIAGIVLIVYGVLVLLGKK